MRLSLTIRLLIPLIVCIPSCNRDRSSDPGAVAERVAWDRRVGPGEVIRTPREYLYPLVHYRQASGYTEYDTEIEDLARHACKTTPWACQEVIRQFRSHPRSLDSNAPRQELEQTALRLARENDPALQEIGIRIACTMCRIDSKECQCDGGACKAPDIALPAPVSESDRMDCGTIWHNGSAYRWGEQVRSIRVSPL